MDDISDIERIGNEIYFKKDDNEIEDNKMSFLTLHEKSTEVTHAGLDEHNDAENNILEIENNDWNKHQTAPTSTSMNTVWSTSNKPTATTVSSPITYPNPFTHKTSNDEENIPNENDTIREDGDALGEEISNEIFQKNETSQTPKPPTFNEKLNKGNLVIEHTKSIDPNQSVKPTLPTMYHNKIYKENSVIKSNDIIDNWDDEADYSYEDFAVEYNGRTVIRQNKIRNHTSYQTSVFKHPLLQGFVATTGYPKFYIGESNCSWRISAPIGQRVRITVLDINLRCKSKWLFLCFLLNHFNVHNDPEIFLLFLFVCFVQTTSYAKILFKYLTWKLVECFSTAAVNTLDLSKC